MTDELTPEDILKIYGEFMEQKKAREQVKDYLPDYKSFAFEWELFLLAKVHKPHPELEKAIDAIIDSHTALHSIRGGEGVFTIVKSVKDIRNKILSLIEPHMLTKEERRHLMDWLPHLTKLCPICESIKYKLEKLGG